MLATLAGQSFGIAGSIDGMMASLSMSRSAFSTSWMGALFVSSWLLPLGGTAFDALGPRTMLLLLTPAFAVALVALSFVSGPLSLTAALGLLRFTGPECCELIAYSAPNLWFLDGSQLASSEPMLKEEERGGGSDSDCSANTHTIGQQQQQQHQQLKQPTSFFHTKGFAIGLLTVVDLSMMLAAPLLRIDIAASGWRAMYRHVALLGGGALLCAALLMPSRATSPHVDAAQEDAASQAEASAEAEGSTSRAGWSFREALACPTLWLLMAARFAVSMIWAGTNIHIVDIMRWVGLPEATLSAHVASNYALVTAASYCATVAASMFMGRITLKLRLVAVGTAAAACSALILALAPPSVPLLAIWAVAFGCFAGTFFTGMAVVAADLFGTRALGRINSLLGGVGTFASGAGPALFAVERDSCGSYHVLLALGIASSLLATALALIPRPAPPRRLSTKMQHDVECSGVDVELTQMKTTLSLHLEST